MHKNIEGDSEDMLNFYYISGEWFRYGTSVYWPIDIRIKFSLVF